MNIVREIVIIRFFVSLAMYVSACLFCFAFLQLRKVTTVLPEELAQNSVLRTVFEIDEVELLYESKF